MQLRPRLQLDLTASHKICWMYLTTSQQCLLQVTFCKTHFFCHVFIRCLPQCCLAWLYSIVSHQPHNPVTFLGTDYVCLHAISHPQAWRVHETGCSHSAIKVPSLQSPPHHSTHQWMVLSGTCQVLIAPYAIPWPLIVPLWTIFMIALSSILQNLFLVSTTHP